MTQLTTQARKTLALCEKVIAKGLHAFIQAGQALAEIRDGDLYGDGYRTFEQYCGLRWGMSLTHANRTINAAIVATHLTPIGVTPANEAQARPLTTVRGDDGDIDLEQVGELWQTAVGEAAEGATVPTAADVERTVREWREARTTPEQPRPATSEPIQAEPDEQPPASPCPNCGAETRDEDGDCRDCHEPAGWDPHEENDHVEDDEEPANVAFKALRKAVAFWHGQHLGVTNAMAAAYLENLAEQLRAEA